ncbi:MAG: S8 family serine peptidase [Acidobacteriota bacterium]
MTTSPVRIPWAIAVVCAALVPVLGQSPDVPRLIVLARAGPPAIEEGVIPDVSHAPGAAESLRRAAIRSSLSEARTGASRAAFAAGRVLVKFREGVSAGARLSTIRAISRTAAMMPRPSHADFDVVRIDPSDDPEAVALALGGETGVEYAQAAYLVHTMFVPNDPLYATLQWNLPLLNLEKAWDIQPQAGSSIIVAVLDSGMAFQDATITGVLPSFVDETGRRYPALGRVTMPYAAAPQLVGAAGAGRIVAPHDFIWDTETPLDFDGHGTHVSGTIGQLTNDGIGTAGVAFNVKLMPVKVIDNLWDALLGAPNDADDETVARGIRYAADNGARIINMSIGRTGPAAPAIEAAVRYAVAKGAFIAIAAGNDFEAGNPTEVLAEIASRVQGAVSVAAVDRDRAHAYYSNTGSWVELAAPGGSDRGFGSEGYVWQQTFDYNFSDTFLLPPARFRAPRFDVFGYIGYIGTSMATPHVSGIAAMLMQQGVTSPAAIEAVLERSAVDLGDKGRDDTFGFGLVDARLALRGLGLAR